MNSYAGLSPRFYSAIFLVSVSTKYCYSANHSLIFKFSLPRFLEDVKFPARRKKKSCLNLTCSSNCPVGSSPVDPAVSQTLTCVAQQ